jgi:hypothetical protein
LNQIFYVFSFLGHIDDLTLEQKYAVTKEMLVLNLPKNLDKNFRLSLSDDEKIYFSCNFNKEDLSQLNFESDLLTFIELSINVDKKIREIISKALSESTTSPVKASDDSISRRKILTDEEFANFNKSNFIWG